MDQRCFDIEIDLEFRPSDRGTLVAHGQQGGGYSIYIDNDEVHYLHNGYGVPTDVNGGMIAAGRQRIVVSAIATSATELDVAISVNGELCCETRGLAMLIGQALFQGIDVGVYCRSPVCWERFASEGTFAFTGRLELVTDRPGLPRRAAGRSDWRSFGSSPSGSTELSREALALPTHRDGGDGNLAHAPYEAGG